LAVTVGWEKREKVTYLSKSGKVFRGGRERYSKRERRAGGQKEKEGPSVVERKC